MQIIEIRPFTSLHIESDSNSFSQIPILLLSQSFRLFIEHLYDMDEFSRSVEDGLKLSLRICSSTRDHRPTTAAPPKTGTMERCGESFLPTCPMVYAEISDPGMVDNPDIPSYQPYVYGRCDPPSLIPLQMKEIEIDAVCVLDTVFVTVRGKWWVHCVTRSKACDCKIAVPMGEQGSILGVEVEIGKRSYNTKIIDSNDEKIQQISKSNGGGFLKPNIFYLTIPNINGGANISATIKWSQKLVYEEGQFSIQIPFSFPHYVNPPPKIFTKREKIKLTLNTGTGKEVLLQGSTHPLKEKNRVGEKMSFAYDEAVENWSIRNFNFAFSIHSNNIFGGILIQPPSINDYDQRDSFCIYLHPGNNKNQKVFKREVIFVIDASLSMQKKPIESVKNAIFASLLDLNEQDYFNLIAFNDEVISFSTCLVPATEEMVQNANTWMSTSLVPKGGTVISQPLNQVVETLSNTKGTLPHIFLITDGSVEGEREICSNLKDQIEKSGTISPRISTFGIGTFCNHYFLRKLASIGRGHYDSAYDADSIVTHMRTWFRRASRTILADVSTDAFDTLNYSEFEVYPENIPDISSACITCIFGRFKGKFPNSVKAKGYVSDFSTIEIDLKVQYTKDIQLDKVFAKEYINSVTAEAWLSQNTQLESKVTKTSIQNSILSEYTRMICLQTNSEKPDPKKPVKKKHIFQNSTETLIQTLTLGFGNVTATNENTPTLFGEKKPPEALEMMFTKAVGCCGSAADCFCCMCCIKACSKVNDQCFIVLSQLCTALACLGCLECCTQVCCNDGDS